MKINKVLLGAFALSMTFASCSNDEPAKGEGSGNVNDGEKYMTVRIANLGNGSRAAGTGFEDPVGTEGTITKDNIRFYFFTEDGRPFTLVTQNVNGDVEKTNMVKPTAITVESSNDGDTKVLVGTLVLGKRDPEQPYLGPTPKYVFCVANPKNAISFENFASKTLTRIQQIEAELPDNFATFAMTSSTYMGADGKEIFCTDVSEHIEDTPDKAEANPAQIYLERLAAKLRVSGLGTLAVKDEATDTEGKTFSYIATVDATGTTTTKTTKLSAELVGWEPLYVPNKCLAIKDIESVLTEPWFNKLNDSQKNRSYWSVTPAIADDAWHNDSFKLTGEDSGNYFKYGSFDKNKGTENVFYTYECTTFAQPTNGVTDRSGKRPAIVVKGIIKTVADDGTVGNAIELVKWNGVLYHADAYKQLVLNAYNQAHSTNPASLADVSFVGMGNNQCEATVRGSKTNFNKFFYWKEGVTSYYLNIQHLEGKYGVVRNHIYDYDVSGVIGLGIPGTDPDNPTPDEETYLAARVNVLSWRVVSNSVVLE